jgi:hypothetical protein
LFATARNIHHPFVRYCTDSSPSGEGYATFGSAALWGGGAFGALKEQVVALGQRHQASG